MKEKDELAKEQLLECAFSEFMEKGFNDASMRSIAEKAGFTTGMLYSRFVDKDALFCELVGEAATELYDYYISVHQEFSMLKPNQQIKELHSYCNDKILKFIDIIYNNFNIFKLIVCKSAGSSYANYIDRLVAIETNSTERFIKILNNNSSCVSSRADMNHMLASSYFNGVFEIVSHDLNKQEAIVYVQKLQEFFDAGWDRLLGLGN